VYKTVDCALTFHVVLVASLAGRIGQVMEE